jgi:hypothetical protein
MKAVTIIHYVSFALVMVVSFLANGNGNVFGFDDVSSRVVVCAVFTTAIVSSLSLVILGQRKIIPIIFLIIYIVLLIPLVVP